MPLRKDPAIVITEKSPHCWGLFLKQKEEPVLKFANVLRRRALGAGNDIEAHPITFGQGLEAFSLNRGMEIGRAHV